MKTIASLFLCGLFFSCRHQNVPETKPISRQVSQVAPAIFNSVIYPVGKGFGFDIFKNGKVYIHQPIIPTWQGWHAFSTKASADAVASLIITKLKTKNFRFLLEKSEVDSTISHLSRMVSSNNPLSGKEAAQWMNYMATSLSIPVRSDLSEAISPLLNFPVKKRWVTKEPVPFGARAGAMSFGIGKFIYMGGGEQKDLKTADFWCYSEQFDCWTCLQEFPGDKKMEGVGFSLNGYGYWSLGKDYKLSSGRFVKDFYQYNSMTNSWSRMEDFPGAPRTNATVFVAGKKAFIGLGYAQDYRADMYEFNPGAKQKWKRIADFAGGPVSSATGIGLASSGYVIAGDSASNNKKFVYQYNPSTDSWKKIGDLPGHPRYFASGCAIDSNLFIAGSGTAEGGEIVFKDFYVFNANTNQWTATENYPIVNRGIYRSISQNANGKVYMGTGHNGNYLDNWNDFEYYYSVRATEGIYEEPHSHPMRYNGFWELFQECDESDCFAGMELKSNEQLGYLSYSSRLESSAGVRILKDENGQSRSFLPRIFSIKTDKQPSRPVSLRLFFTKNEIASALRDYIRKDRSTNSLTDLALLQYNDEHPDTDPSNNLPDKKRYTYLKPKWHYYGSNGESLVAEFTVSSLSSEFYIIFVAK